MKKNTQHAWISFILGIFTMWLLRTIYSMELMTFEEIVSSVVLIITAGIVWRYTLATQKSNEIQERPLLDFYIFEQSIGPNRHFDFRVRNIGKSPAYNIRIETIKTPEGYTYGPYLEDDINLKIDVESMQKIKFWVKTRTNATEAYQNITGFQFLINRLFMSDPISDYVKKTRGMFLINYDGVNGVPYYSVFRFYPSLALIMQNTIMTQFVASGKGVCSVKKAKELCKEKPLNLHALENTDNDHKRKVDVNIYLLKYYLYCKTKLFYLLKILNRRN